MKNINTYEFESYIVPSYMDILLLQHAKNLLIKKVKNEKFLSIFQQDMFSLLAMYFLLLHNTIVLEICKITQKPKRKDDISLISFLEEKMEIDIINEIYNKYKPIRDKKISHLTTVKFSIKKYEKKKNELILQQEYADLYSFETIDKDIKKIKKIMKKYASCLGVNIISIQKIMKQRYNNFPTITPNDIICKKLFFPLM